jgi:hypothetical protein
MTELCTARGCGRRMDPFLVATGATVHAGCGLTGKERLGALLWYAETTRRLLNDAIAAGKKLEPRKVALDVIREAATYSPFLSANTIAATLDALVIRPADRKAAWAAAVKAGYVTVEPVAVGTGKAQTTAYRSALYRKLTPGQQRKRDDKLDVAVPA